MQISEEFGSIPDANQQPMPEPAEQLTELRQLLITSHQDQLKISRSLLMARQASEWRAGVR
jgi:hypothetical protein